MRPTRELKQTDNNDLRWKYQFQLSESLKDRVLFQAGWWIVERATLERKALFASLDPEPNPVSGYDSWAFRGAKSHQLKPPSLSSFQDRLTDESDGPATSPVCPPTPRNFT
jgi:hypothetical protein